ncbi:AraC family transcriptional regulator [Shewanella gelidii]|uniref:AraC family transcriptional regulator n=1 Tax=Shewanella gelidii TaxID=1642821 RepID=A0A917JIY9_9GAMM|nr:GyrI-like domain-containing protein [Shewanella gelidii]MCL1097004.1 AraC family transcriptional regulator [Shewanella gelidii]GGI71858.1 AraC family transcriptional regulator [Shewanella gelidii]
MGHNTAAYKIRVCAAMNYISQNLERDLSLDEIAEVAAFSKFHFHRIFKAVVGETVADFTRRLRLETAANRLLSNEFDDITTIAMECGFSSSQNFAKAFRQCFNITPSQYRKSKIGNKERNSENALSLKALYDPDTAFINQLNSKRRSAMKAEIKQMPQLNVAYVRKIGAYGKEICEQAMTELCQWAAPRGHLATGKIVSVYWDNPEVTPAEKCRVDACVSVPNGTAVEGKVALQTITGGLYGVCHFEVPCDGFQQAWDDAFGWLVTSGYECADKPCYELYHNNAEEHPEGKWIFDICIPLKSDK